MAKNGSQVFLTDIFSGKHATEGVAHGSEDSIFLVSFKINEGKFEAFKEIAQAMIAFTQKEAGTLAYEWYFSTDQTKGRLLENARKMRSPRTWRAVQCELVEDS